MKKIALIVLMAVLMLTLTACGKFTCDLCGDVKRGKQHKSEVFGEKIVICNDCYKELEAIGELFAN